MVRKLSKDGTDLCKLSTELRDKVFEGVEDFPIGMDEAKTIRLELMKERSIHGQQQNAAFEAPVFHLCER